jgi:peptide/nickel transport system permease protein
MLIFIPTMVLLSLLIFISLELGPGDIASYMLGPEQDVEQVERLREALGLNKPWPVRYVNWMTEVMRGNWGHSMLDGTPVKALLLVRIPRTLKLMTLSLIVAVIFGVVLGVMSALHQYSALDHTLTTIGLIGISIPAFFTALLAIFLFSIKLKLFPIGGVATEAGVFNAIKVMILPATVLGLRSGSEFLRYARGSMLDVIHKEYMMLAKSKGLPPWRVNYLHGLRTALIPIVTIIVLRLPILISGSVIIEQVFSWPGIGTMFINAARAKDFPVVMMVALLITGAMLLASLLADILLAFIDPRVRYE